MRENLATTDLVSPSLVGADSKVRQAALSRLEALVTAHDRLIAKFDERSLAVLSSRILALANKATLQELGTRFGLTRERIRQVEVIIEKKVRHRLSSRDNKDFRDASSRFQDQLGLVFPTDRLQTLQQLLSESEITRDHALLLPILIWSAGPYEQWGDFFVRAPAEKVVAQTRKAIRALTRRGPVEAIEGSEPLARLGIHGEFHRRWILGLGEFRFLDKYLASWTGSLADKAEIVLKIRGCPMNREEISAEIGEQFNIDSLANRFSDDPRFCRTDLSHFGLKKWGLDEYSSIVDELVSEITEKGGEASAEYLVSTLTSKFHVSASSVKSYLAGPRFIGTSRGTMLVRTEQEPFTPGRKIELTKRCYRLKTGWAYRIPVDEELLRGSGRTLPSAFASEIDLAPLKRLRLASQCGVIPVSWPSQQPSIGSLRGVVEKLGGVLGDYVFVECVSASRLRFTLTKKEMIERAAGLERLVLETCASSVPDGSEPLQRIARALGLDATASLHAIRRRLETRGEDDLLPFLPQVLGGDEDAIRDLLELVGG
ncbi:MAG: sigma factor-like helix-turn-helix DNA-binding protein [Terriglobales bacterium]